MHTRTVDPQGATEAEAWPFEDLPAYVWQPPRPGGEHWSFSTWWLETAGPGWSLLYGWLLRRPETASDRCSVASVDNVDGLKVIRVVLDASGTAVFAVVNLLLAGRCMADACQAVSLVANDARLPDLRFGKKAEEINSEFVRFPWMIAESSQIMAHLADSSRGMSSLAGDALCVFRSIVRNDLSRIFGRAEVPIDSFIQRLLSVLHDDTGHDFSGNDFQRFGSIEAMWFPSLTETERSCVVVDVHGASVRVRIKATPDDRHLMVRQRQSARGCVLADETRLVVIDEVTRETTLLFGAPTGGPFSTLVEVWTRRDDSAPFLLWHANVYHWIRQIHTRMGLMGRRMNIASDWLQTFSNARTTAERAAKMRTVTLSSHHEMISGDPYPPFEDLVASRRDASSALRTEASDDRFFDQGTGVDGGRLDIAEWVQAKLNDQQVQRAIILDPYFDTWGFDLLLRTQPSDIHVVVLTSSQHRTDGGTKFRERFLEAEDIARLLIGGRSLRVLDLRKTGATSSDQYFHDRYILLFGRATAPISGYHLSNSLQQATVNFPLLVTRIASDVLVQVSDYVGHLLDSNANAKVGRELVPLFSSLTADQTASRDTTENTGTPASLDECIEGLRSATASTFADAWGVTCQRLANLPGSGTDLNEIVAALGDPLLDGLDSFLRTAHERESPLGTKDMPLRYESVALAQALNQSFDDDLIDAANILEHHHRDHWRPWTAYYAARVLRRAPQQLISILETLIPMAGATDRPPSAAIAEIVGHIVGNVVESAVMGEQAIALALLGSTVPTLRALGVAAALRSKVDLVDLVRSGLSDPRERVLAFASWVYRYRVAANRGSQDREARVESAEIAEGRSAMFSAIIEDWPPELGVEDIKRVIDLAGGPVEGSWCLSTHSGLLAPLVQSEKLSEDTVVVLWSRMLRGHLEGCIKGEHQFFPPADSELSELIAFLWTTRVTPAAALEVEVESIAAISRKAIRALGRPFIQATNYDRWSGAVSFLIWIGALGDLVLMSPDPPSWVATAVSRWSRQALGVRAFADARDPSGLIKFYDAVRTEAELRRMRTPESQK